MIKLININANEALNSDSLLILKGGTKKTSPFTNNEEGRILAVDGGDETDKRPKRPTVGSSSVLNVVLK
jgi:hypothetical protein